MSSECLSLLFLWFCSIFNLLYDKTALLNTDETKLSSLLGNTFFSHFMGALTMWPTVFWMLFQAAQADGLHSAAIWGVGGQGKRRLGADNTCHDQVLNFCSWSFPLAVDLIFQYINNSCKISGKCSPPKEPSGEAAVISTVAGSLQSCKKHLPGHPQGNLGHALTCRVVSTEILCSSAPFDCSIYQQSSSWKLGHLDRSLNGFRWAQEP